MTRELRTSDPGSTVAGLVHRLGEPQDLEIIRPSLEDVYLKMVEEYDARPTAGDPVETATEKSNR